MCPTIRIDSEVYTWLQSQAVPLEDTPNSVLRRLAGLDGGDHSSPPSQARKSGSQRSKSSSGRRLPAATGDELLERWKLPAIQARFHHEGTFYQHLERFPAALCDRNGYVVFETEHEYRNCPLIQIGEKVNVHDGISSILGYTKVDDPVI